MGRSSTVTGLLAPLLVLAAGCTGSGPPEPARKADPPAPAAACLLDPDALAAGSGVAWIPDRSIASDTRCVYDVATAGSTPAPADGPRAFLVVETAPIRGGDPAAELETVAQVCAEGSRAPVTAAQDGFVCRLAGGGVFAATVRDGELVTLAAASVPAASTADRLATALAEQLTFLD
ncbi:hypothetical protein ACVGOW_16585 [Pseudonocardia saturnea]